MSDQINLKNIYKLPWTEFDNPNGWIEPTTFCNIKCPGCYRSINSAQHKPEHLDLETLQKQVDWFIKERNIQTISIAGGEPLMYPYLKELISYIAGYKRHIMLYTNGSLLTTDLAKELSNSGLTQLVIHVDKHQERAEYKSLSHRELRKKYVNMLKDISDLRIGFIQPIAANEEHEVADILQFLKENISKVNLMVFTLYRDLCNPAKQTVADSKYLNANDLVTIINKYDSFKPTAYLNSELNSSDITWLFAQRMGATGKILGNMSSSLYKFIHSRYRKKAKRHMFIIRSNSISLFKLMKMLYRISILKVVINYLRNGILGKGWSDGKINFQTLLILKAPDYKDGQWNLCTGCPDRMIYNGKLLPSCILDNIKNNANDNFETVKLSNN